MKLTRYRTVPYLRTGHNSHRSAGRNHLGRITVRHRGGGHARALITLDWNRTGESGRVVGFTYDPRRSARLAVVLNSTTVSPSQQRPYSHILAAAGRTLFQPVRTHRPTDSVSSAFTEKLSPPCPGDRVVVGSCEPGDFLHAVEPHSHHGPRFARAAGSSVQVRAVDSAASLGLKTGIVTVRLPSGAQRNIPAQSRASLGRVATSPKSSLLPGKAGRSRWLGRRPTVRGVAINPVDHPHGGNTAGGRPSVTFRGWPTKGQPTRAPRRQNRFLIPSRSSNLQLMSRSSWKPPFVPPIRRLLLESNRPGVAANIESVIRPRAVRLATSRVGRRVRVLTGLRAVSLTVTPEMVGHAIGEFAPTRKRPRVTRVVKAVKGKPPIAKASTRKL